MTNREAIETQYCENECRKQILMVIEPQVNLQTPRSDLYKWNDEMPADQIQYKKELQEIYLVGLSRFIGILFMNCYMAKEKFEKICNAIFMQNCVSSQEPLFDAKSDGKFVFKPCIYKQQIALLNQVLPALFWYVDDMATKQYVLPVTKEPTEEMLQLASAFFQDPIHAKFLKF